jgi:hypothetical protein
MVKNSIRLVVGILAVQLICLMPGAQESSGTITITEIPPAGAGPDSQGNISGTIKGVEKPETFKIVLYAHTDWWYVQPLADSPYTDIGTDGHWSSWTHLGQRYAVLLVTSSYRPPAKVQSLPSIGGMIVAKAEIAASSSH